MLQVALEAEVEAYIAAHAALVDERGHRLVVRNGHAPARSITTGVGQVEVVRPRVDDRRVDPATDERGRFQSVILPRWCRRSPKVAELLPLLYLHGLSSLDFVPALEGFGASAGLSASVVTRLTVQGRPSGRRSCAGTCWTATMCTAGLTACTSTSAWRTGGCVAWCSWGCASMAQRAGGGRRRAAGVRRCVGGAAARLPPPRHARPSGHGERRRARAVDALGEVFPDTREQRCWVHKAANVLNALPKSVRADARTALNEIAPGRGSRPRGHPGVRRRLRRQVAQGGRQGGRRHPGAAHLLRLSGRALDPSQDHESDRVDLLAGAGRRPRRARALGRRSHPRSGQLCNRTLVERTTRFTMLLHLPRMTGHGQPRIKNGPALGRVSKVIATG